MRIAMIGLKGIPAKWGGIEKYVEEIGKRLVGRGHEVSVFGSNWYCREYVQSVYEGMRVRKVPAIHHHATDAISNAFLSSLCTACGAYDVAHFHGHASYLFLPIVKRSGKATVVTAHGVESGWENPKHGGVARYIIRTAFRKGLKTAHGATAVAAHLQDRIKEQFGVGSIVTPSGIDQREVVPPSLIRKKYQLSGQDYLLFLGRIDPIKRIESIVDLTSRLKSRVRIVIAGGPQDSSSSAYYQRLVQMSDQTSGCIFTGPVFGQEKEELLSNCTAFISASENEGLPIALLEALSYGRCAVVSDIDAHREVIEDGVSGFLFNHQDSSALARTVSRVLGLRQEELVRLGDQARDRTEKAFNWDRTTDLFEQVYKRCIDECKQSR